MPQIRTASDVRRLREAMRTDHVRLRDFRKVVDRKMLDVLSPLKGILAPDYQKSFIPSQTGVPGKALFRLTNIMSSNSVELRVRVRSTDPAKVNLGQKMEHALEAINDQLFPMPVRRRMRQFLVDAYTVMALDILPRRDALAQYADREGLQQYAEAEDGDDEDDTPESTYRRAYRNTDAKLTATERHEEAYDAVTSDALVADGLCLRVRVIDPETFEGFQTDDDPNRFAIGMEYGRKPLSPLQFQVLLVQFPAQPVDFTRQRVVRALELFGHVVVDAKHRNEIT